MERLTIKDIAKMAGVSHTTVSRALNGAQNIRPETYAKRFGGHRDYRAGYL